MLEFNIFCTLMGIIKKNIALQNAKGELTYYKHRPCYRQTSFLHHTNKKVLVLITLGVLLNGKKWSMHICIHLYSVLLNNSLLLSRSLNFVISNEGEALWSVSDRLSFFFSTRLYCHLLSWKSLPCHIVTQQRRRDWSYWDSLLFCISVGKILRFFSSSHLLFKIWPNALF